MTSPDDQRLKSEFISFYSNPGVEPPPGMSGPVKQRIIENLQPTLLKALVQGMALHAVSGAMTLLICPQFGIGPLGGGKGLMGFVESYGHVVCGLFCGLMFMGLTGVIAPFWLDRPIRRVLSRHPLAVALLLSLTSLLALLFIAFMGGERLPHLHTQFLLAWVGAAVLTAYGWIFRRQFW